MLREELEIEKKKLQVKLAEIEDERLKILEKARFEAEQEAEKLYREIDAIRKQAGAPIKSTHKKKILRDQVRDLVEKINEPIEKRHFQPQQRRPLRIGDRVHIRRLGTEGVVSSLTEDEVEVQIGKMRVKVDLLDIERSKNEGKKGKQEETEDHSDSYKDIFYPSPGMELHLRGMRAEDALVALERYLDAAHAAGLPFVRIVHGKGTGTLRQVVREALENAQLVERWEHALDNEGGEGVTVAFLKDS